MKSPLSAKQTTYLLGAVAALCTLLNSRASATPGVIDSAYDAANGHWYYLLANSNWTDAETAAVGLGGHLATVNDSAENNFVWSQWGANRNLWIGLYDPTIGDGNGAQHAANFLWSSGDSSAFRNWRPGEPNNGNNGEYDAYILAGSLVPGGVWNDGPNATSIAGQPLLYGVAEVPEPAAGLLLLTGVIAAVWTARNRFQKLNR